MTSPDSPRPAYLEIADRLREQIEARELVPGDRFPTERDLVEQFGVARMTVRHALEILQSEGLIDRRRGRSGGTFVRATPPTVQLNRVDCVIAQLAADGEDVRVETEVVEKIFVPRYLMSQLQLMERDEVWRARRVRFFRDVPVSLVTDYVPDAILPHDLPPDEIAAWLVSNTAQKHEELKAVTANVTEQERLDVPRTQPLLKLCRTLRNAEGQIIMVSEEFLRTDQLNVEIVVNDTPTAYL